VDALAGIPYRGGYKGCGIHLIQPCAGHSNKEAILYARVAKYRFAAETIDEIIQRAEEGFVPIIRQVPGFIAYYIIDGGDGTGVVVAVFEDQAGAEESVRRAAEWVQANLAELIPNPPEVTVGEVRVHTTALLTMEEAVEAMKKAGAQVYAAPEG